MLFGNINYSSAGKAVLFFFWALASVLPSSTWTSQQSTRDAEAKPDKVLLEMWKPKTSPPPKEKKKKQKTKRNLAQC